jgi:hypothetical protein
MRRGPLKEVSVLEREVLTAVPEGVGGCRPVSSHRLPQVITLEGWVDIMYYVMDAHSFYNFIYFILLIIVSAVWAFREGWDGLCPCTL